ncbi:MAG: hypothetical protein JWO15_3741 [Sphingomonadales bacterium]|nr:hypothetical protein [Sphingomonadales bacterium]
MSVYLARSVPSRQLHAVTDPPGQESSAGPPLCGKNLPETYRVTTTSFRAQPIPSADAARLLERASASGATVCLECRVHLAAEVDT